MLSCAVGSLYPNGSEFSPSTMLIRFDGWSVGAVLFWAGAGATPLLEIMLISSLIFSSIALFVDFTCRYGQLFPFLHPPCVK